MAGTKKPSPNTRAVTRQDVLDAVGDLRSDLLDPQNPLSLFSSIQDKFDATQVAINEHIKRVDMLANRIDTVAGDLRAHKEQYAGDKGRVIGWAGAISAAASAAVKFLFPPKL